MHILIVEDEIPLAKSLNQIMIAQKYIPTLAYNGEDGFSFACQASYDIIILDVMLPGQNGFEIIQALRKRNIATPVILLTALDNISDKVKGLNYGADDYMTKPFSSEELLARINALTRRKGDVIVHELTFDDLTLNVSTCELYCNEKHIHLGYKEFEILKLLMKHTSMILSKEDLIIKVWGYQSEAEDNNVEAYISFLRKKFFYLGSKVAIKTLRKLGYQLESSHHD